MPVNVDRDIVQAAARTMIVMARIALVGDPLPNSINIGI